MQLSELFPRHNILVRLDAGSKDDLLARLADVVAEGSDLDRDSVATALRQREELGSTGLGRGIALPHARIDGLPEAVGIVATLAQPIDYESPDFEPVDVALMVLLPEGKGGDQMKVLSRVAGLARSAEVVDAIRSAESPAEISKIVAEQDV